MDFAKSRRMMVDGQVRTADVTRYPIIQAMLNVPREDFVPLDLRAVAYAGDHIPLGEPGRVILDPRIFAKLLDTLEVGPRDFVLDLGPGLGYSAAILGRVAEAVVGIEPDARMAEEAARTLSEHGIDNVVVSQGALTDGDPAHQPYDVIVIEGGVEVLPDALFDQLKEGGRIGAVFVTGAAGQARIGVKSGGRLAWRHVFDATVPVLPGFEKTESFAF